MRRAIAVVIAVSCCSALASSPASATAPLVFQYRIEHPTYGDIGTFTNTIVKTDGTTDVQTRVRVAVKLLGATLFREVSDRTEQWRDDRLVSFHGVTNKDGRRFEVTGEARGDRFVVNGPDGTFVAPADVQPPNPWSARCLKSGTMLSSLSGRVFAAHVLDRGQDVVVIGGQRHRVHKYEIDTDRTHVVWFDDRGVPLRIDSVEDGEPVRLVLTEYPDQPDAIAVALPH